MQLISRIDLQPHKSHRECTFAGELKTKVKRLSGCLPRNALPFPSAEVIAAWNDLPNVTVDNLSATMRAEIISSRSPPATPTGLAFDTDGPASRGPSPGGRHDGVDNATPDASDAVVPQTLEGATTSEDGSASRCSNSKQSLDQPINEDALQSSDGSSSDQVSLSSGCGSSPMPARFDVMVDQWLLDYRARGMQAFIDSLIAFGVISVGTTSQASRIARAVVKRVTKVSYAEGRSLEDAIRFSVLDAFNKCWVMNDTPPEISSVQAHTTPPTPYGLNIASLVGSLLAEKLSNANDIHLCLTLLLEGEKRFDRLCAMHALLIQANDKLCKNRCLPALMEFKDGVTCTGKEPGEYLWVTTPHSRVILTDILGLIERWVISQAIKRERGLLSLGTGHRIIRNSAVGPRLRNRPANA